MTSALFTAFALIATGQVEPAVEDGLAPKLRSEAPADDPLLRLETLLRFEDEKGRG